MHTKYAMATSNLSVDTFKLNYVSHQHQLSTESWLNFLARISITHTWGLAIRLGTTCNSGRIPQAIRWNSHQSSCWNCNALLLLIFHCPKQVTCLCPAPQRRCNSAREDQALRICKYLSQLILLVINIYSFSFIYQKYTIFSISFLKELFTEERPESNFPKWWLVFFLAGLNVVPFVWRTVN